VDLVVPQHLLFLGGGYIALELAQAMRRLGSRVTVCEGNERILGGEDPDIAEAILKLLQDEGIVDLKPRYARRHRASPTHDQRAERPMASPESSSPDV
jgi:pyruvate/2-oxoglutarate dehydrogenase complex dihydrolipoamide dehydrogenase (E3) component